MFVSGGNAIVIPATTVITSVGFPMLGFLIEDFSFVIIIVVGWVVEERRELETAIVVVTIGDHCCKDRILKSVIAFWRSAGEEKGSGSQCRIGKMSRQE